MSVLMDGSTDSIVTEKEPFTLRLRGYANAEKLLINIETNFS